MKLYRNQRGVFHPLVLIFGVGLFAFFLFFVGHSIAPDWGGHKATTWDIFKRTLSSTGNLLIGNSNISGQWLSESEIREQIPKHKRYLAQQPEASGYSILAEMYDEIGEKELALAAIEEAIRLEPQASWWKLNGCEIADDPKHPFCVEYNRITSAQLEKALAKNRERYNAAQQAKRKAPSQRYQQNYRSRTNHSSVRRTVTSMPKQAPKTFGVPMRK